MVVSFWRDNGIVPEESQDAYVYGIQLLLSTAINVACLIIISWLLGKTFAWIPFMIGFVPLRMTAGGYHAKTPLRCGITFCSTYAVLLCLMHFLPASGQVYIILGNGIATLILVFLFSPAPAVNKPLTAIEAMRNRRRSLLIAIGSLPIMTIAAKSYFLSNVILYISFGQIASVIFLSLTRIGRTHEFI